MKKVIIALFLFSLMSTSVDAVQYINSPARRPSYSAPISRGGFTTSFPSSTNLRVPVGKTSNRVQPISSNGFTTSFPKDTNAFHQKTGYKTPIVQRQPRHYSVSYSSDGTKKVYRNNTSRTASKVSSACYGITYYDRSGNVSRCN